jgi:hypothetical protein
MSKLLVILHGSVDVYFSLLSFSVSPHKNEAFYVFQHVFIQQTEKYGSRDDFCRRIFVLN